MTQLARIDPSLSQHRREEVEAELQLLNATLLDQQRLIEVLREEPLGNAEGFSRPLAALGRPRTPEVWLTAFAINGSTSAIELSGRSTRPELVPQYLQQLGQQEVLAGVQFDRFELGSDEQTGETVFRATSRAAAAMLAASGERGRQ
jgi:MSHA biogenesis protein MshI